jgi:hypothetical protein
MKQTAMQKLINKILDSELYRLLYYLEVRATELLKEEEQQIKDAYIQCEKDKRERMLKDGFLLIEAWNEVDEKYYKELADQYYKETYNK